MALFKPGSSGALPFLEQCASVEDLPEGGLILREIYGYSPGIKVDKPTPEALDHNGIMQADETGFSALQTAWPKGASATGERSSHGPNCGRNVTK